MGAGTRPAVAARQLVCVAAAHGVDAPDVLEGTALTVAELDDPECLVSLADEVTMVRNLIARGLDQRRLGSETGDRATVTNFGIVGYAAMASRTMRDVVPMGLRFLSLTALRFDVRVSEADDEFVVRLDVAHVPPTVQPFFAYRDLAIIGRTMPQIAGDVPQRYASRAVLEMDLSAELVPLVPARVEPRRSPGSAFCTIRLPSAFLDEPLPQPDERTRAACIAQCEQVLHELSARHDVSANVRSELLGTPGHLPGIDSVAHNLHLHPRTLRRRLAEEGTTFRALTTEVRMIMSAELLLKGGLSAQEVGHLVGYAEQSAFTRAFVSWFGCPPSAYQRSRRGRVRT